MTDARFGGGPVASAAVPVVVLGGSGYVAGELLRLLVGHPSFRLAAVVSESRAAAPVVESFPHLRGTAVDGMTFADGGTAAALVARLPRLGVFSALPHGEAAARIDALLTTAAGAGCEVRVVDLSADFRHRDPVRYAEIYGKLHAAPHRLQEFYCGLPELANGDAGELGHVAHPGCFTTAASLALAPLLVGGWIEPLATVVAVTGSTGAGRTLSATTHHPERRSDLFAYSPLGHRHEPEMRALLAAVCAAAQRSDAVGAPTIHFVPQSGPFARGIHATATARLARPVAGADEIRAAVSSFYESSSAVASAANQTSPTAAPARFVRVLDAPPRLQGVVGTNRCDLAYAVHDGQLVAFAALDNLVKGAAGGGVQWMNRLFGLPESAGLELPGLGWL